MKVNVANAPGDDYESSVPSGYVSWIDYWNKLRYPRNEKYASWCRNCGTKTDELEGGHVEYCYQRDDGDWYYKKSNGIFVTPLCTECNNPNNTVHFSVDDTELIKVP
jgi:hypothetical protein